jgi:acetylornithine deacetylase/succinyl-diaminopimelate desuccinylase-like protein
MFAGISRAQSFPQSFLLRNLRNPFIFRLLRGQLTADNNISAILQDTISVTVLRAGEKENVIPDKAEATLDVRLLPERDPQAFIMKLKSVVNDERVQFEVIQYPEETTISSVDSDFYRALGAVLGENVGGTAVAPMLTPGTTDSCFFRRKGVHSYGLFPAILTPGELARFHGIDERISIANLQLGTKIMFETLKRLLS